MILAVRGAISSAYEHSFIPYNIMRSRYLTTTSE